MTTKRQAAERLDQIADNLTTAVVSLTREELRALARELRKKPKGRDEK